MTPPTPIKNVKVLLTDTGLAPDYRTVLAANEVHIYQARIKDIPDKLTNFLSDDEKLRAARYVLTRKRKSFALSRGLLRTVLGTYLSTAPAEIEFTTGEFGKPGLNKKTLNGSGLEFNISHSKDVCMIAVSKDTPVGIDAEHITDRDYLALAKRFFHKNEVIALASLSDQERQAAFYRCWTRKEAFIKALGTGLHTPLKSFQVNISKAEKSALTGYAGIAELSPNLTILNLDVNVAPGYAASVAVNGKVEEVKNFTVATVGIEQESNDKI